MVQVKKESVRNAILDSAFGLLAKKGYSQTTLAEIAREAGISPANIYRYYDSKLALAQAVGARWSLERFDALERRLKRIKEPRAKLRTLLLGLWRDIPEADDGFGANFVEAIASASRSEFSPAILPQWEARIAELMRDSLPPSRRHLADPSLLPHFSIMAYDGFTLNVRLFGRSRRVRPVVDMMCDLLLGTPRAAARTTGER